MLPRPATRREPDPYLDRITEILRRALHDKACAVYLFGSRADGTNTAVSDYDIAVLGDNLSRELSLARELLEESTIPFKVDVVDLNVTSAEFRRNVERDGVLLWRN